MGQRGRRADVVFVGHDASRSGAPTALASFLGWLARSAGTDARLVLLAGGALVPTYQRMVPTRCVAGGGAGVVAGAARGLGAVGAPLAGGLDRSARRLSLLGAAQADLVVANTLAALPAAAELAGGRSRLACVVHELDGVARRVLPASPAAAARLLRRVARFVAVSGWVERMLVDRFAVDPGRVEVVPELIDPPTVVDGDVAAARRTLAPPGGPLLVGAGPAGPRKGTDLFVSLVAALAGAGIDAAGAWVGGTPGHAPWEEAARDVADAGPAGRVRLVPTVTDARPWLAAADVVVSTAREDPCPLTVLEAGALGVPVAAFATGGAADVLAGADLADLVAPAGDVLGLADRLAPLLADGARRRSAGDRLADHVTTHHLTGQVAPRLWAALQR